MGSLPRQGSGPELAPRRAIHRSSYYARLVVNATQLGVLGWDVLAGCGWGILRLERLWNGLLGVRFGTEWNFPRKIGRHAEKGC